MNASSDLRIHSVAFEHGGPIPVKYTADGENISPPIGWGKVPEGTAGLVLVAEDPDAPSPFFPIIKWVHWVVYGIPPDVTALVEGLPPEPVLPGGIRQGVSSFKKFGYGGPAPPFGEHRYYFRIYATDINPAFSSPRVTKKEVLKAIKGHILAQGELMGRYRRGG
jgi:Raf kinase inhibitor-like YbhB/YbcL family protein